MKQVFIISFILTIALAGATFADKTFDMKNAPKIKSNCSICHVTHKMVNGTMMLRTILSEVCIDCHADRRAPVEHVVGVVPTYMIKKLPLDEQGRLTCITCHEPHGEGNQPKMLRDKPSLICKYCHNM